MQSTVVTELPTLDDVRVLLRRCRHALAVGAPEWEFDVEKAMAIDAALVIAIDVMLRTLG